jgi:mannose-6-phosphate isomerase-like protein (cupin superfamily)
MDSVISIICEGTEIGTIVRSDFHSSGISFFSNDESYLQLGYMNRSQDYVISPHVHNKIERIISFTEEILFVRSGKVRVDFYKSDKEYLESYFVYGGDIVVLKSGGHGFKFYEDSEIFEVKQGPYLKEQDKIRYTPIDDSEVIIKNK